MACGIGISLRFLPSIKARAFAIEAAEAMTYCGVAADPKAAFEA
jgi:hypothetical protein